MEQKQWKMVIALGVCGIIVVAIVLNSSFISSVRGPGEEDEGEEGYQVPPVNYPASSGGRDNNEPTIAINPKDPNNIVTAANDYNTPNGGAWVGYYTSHDSGVTWKEDLIHGYRGDTVVTELTGFEGAGDPVLATSSEGHFYLAGICFKRAVNPLNPVGFGYNFARANGIFVAKSTNGGDSFDQVTVVWTALQSLVTFHDKEWLGVDPNNGNVYVCWSMFSAMLLSQLVFSRSTDGGQTWSAPIIITEYQSQEMNIQGSAIVVDKDSNIHVTWIDFGGNTIRYARSTDQGQSFEAPISIAPVTPLPRYLETSNYRTPTMTMLAVDNFGGPMDGSLYCTWADYSTGDGDTLLVSSHDGGGSWSEPVRVNNDTFENGADQFFPAVAVSKEGFVHVTFYDRRDDPDNVWLEYWWAVSFDGGETFPLNVCISDATFNGDYSRADDNDFIGDYTGVASSEKIVAAIWCDTREGSESSADSEVYVAIIDYMLAFEALGFDPNDHGAVVEEKEE